MVAPVRILLVDELPIVLVGITTLIGANQRFDIVGEATDGRTALQMAAELTPDVVLMDISLPELHGIEVIRSLRAQQRHVHLVVFTMHDERSYLRQLLELGVRGYLLKRSAVGELPHAIEAVLAGGMYIDPAIAGKVLDGPERVAERTQQPRTTELSEREAYVLRLIAEGRTNKEIASRLNIGTGTVTSYKARAFEKLGIRSLIDVAKYAALQGWVQD